MNGKFVFGIAATLVAALVPQASLAGEAAEINARATLRAAEGKKSAKRLKAKGPTRGGLDDEDRMENLRVQQNMDRYQKSTTIQSGVAKKQDESKKGMVKKMK
jgi:hypothetical protein